MSTNKNKIEVILAGAELAPIVKVGGLGDVMGSLPKALARLGIKVKIFVPFYGSINKKYKTKLVKANVSLDIDNGKSKFSIYQGILPGSSVPVYLIKHKLFNGPKIYVGSRKYFNKGKYVASRGCYSRRPTDVERFVFFSKAVVEAIRTLGFKPQVVHCHDWHTALIPTFIDEYSLADKNFKNIKTLFTIHNLANQGIVKNDILGYADLHRSLTPAVMEDYYDHDGQMIDLMKIGILSADYINTVSPTYAREILTKEYGASLEEYLRRRRKDLGGVLNGIDTDFFNPRHDKFVKKRYSARTWLSAKKINKESLQRLVKLPSADMPLFGLVSRLVGQKGLDILIPALDELLAKQDSQVVILGAGKDNYQKSFSYLAKKYPNKVKLFLAFDVALAQKIYAGSDFFLMPSRFEPCGLGQMIAMRYGTVPIARATGGLRDTVRNNKNGLVFKEYSISALAKTLRRSIDLYNNHGKFKLMATYAMTEDFSWDKSAKNYKKIYNKLCQ